MAEGYWVWCVHDGEAAWPPCSSLPDLILSDIKMPKLDGVTLAVRLAEAASGIPVLLMSAGHDDWADVRRAFLRKTHVSSLLTKLDADTRVQLAVIAAGDTWRERC